MSIGSVCWMIFYQNTRLWAALASTSFSFAASMVIALLAAWRQRQTRMLPIPVEAILIQS
ncbi:MAG TPA: hypothetical protein VIJ40_04125 [Acidimicrobiales bacterium]